MTWIAQADVGRCDFIDVLEEAVLRRRAVQLRLVDGSELTAQVLDVTTRAEGDFVRLSSDDEVPVVRIAGMERA